MALILRRADRMQHCDTQELVIEINPTEAVSALLCRPADAVAGYVFAHGAGAGMRHSSMDAIAAALAQRAVATLRYQFRYMGRGSKRPDPPGIAHAAVRAAVAKASLLMP